ncbi:MAG TPA: coenzyme F420-0:L-glutamate ligase [Acetobacteraceae bacterium]|jgi:coenzyme F420-0:L-glutamate ligase/coenzyme F420-1:gamma-L-glutamate ligase|nr:coenzyme F420-0:L-glutamate ligase [Acetobacteraceae bacterium]
MIVELLTLPGIPLVQSGDDLVLLIIDGLAQADVYPRDGDIFVLAQKIVSKAEGRMVDLATVTPGKKAEELALVVNKDPRLVELVLSETANIILAKPGSLLVEHRLGFVMPNAGIDMSNIGPPDHEKALLLPVDPDGSAEILRERLSDAFGMNVGVVINDSVSRAWRKGSCGVAIGSAGLPVFNDLRGEKDLLGRELKTSITGFADEVAAAASLVMGQRDEGTPIVVIRGLKWPEQKTSASHLLSRPSVVSPELVAQVQYA